MTKMIRSQLALAAVIAVASAVCFAQSGGEATYGLKCKTCHGATGTPSAGMAKAMGIKAASDPDIQKLSVAQIAAVVKDGKGKMHPVTGLSDDQIKDVAAFYKGLK